MKNLLLIALLALAPGLAVAQTTAPAAAPAAVAAAPHVNPPKVDVLNASDGSYGNITQANKERDEAKAQLSTLQAQQQQQAVVTEYYKVVAERNEALLRATQLQIQLNDAQAKLTAANGELDHLRATAAAKK